MKSSNIFRVDEKDLVQQEEKIYYLMLKDRKLIEVRGSEVIVFKRNLLPLSLRGKLNIEYADYLDWLSNRVLPLSRTNAKMILNNLGLPQGNIKEIAIACKALSLIDCYWIKEEGSNDTWESINLYDNHFSESVGKLAFTGHSKVSVTGQYLTPELTNLGNFAKSWVREDDELYLYKSNTNGGKESQIEFAVSRLLNAAGVNHVPYQLLNHEGRIASKCSNIANQNLMILPANDIIRFSADIKQQPIKLIENMYGKDFNTMLVVDYLINNYDRHTYNWGFYMESDTGNVLGMHPLFDHNCSLNFEIEEHMSITYASRTLKEVAITAYQMLEDKSLVNNIINYLNLDEAYQLFNGLFKTDLVWSKVKERCEELLSTDS